MRYDLADLSKFPTLTLDRLRLAYREACLSRMHVERVVQECLKGTVKFSIWGPGEEIYATAAALALDDVVDPSAFAIGGHYRSAPLFAMWARLRGVDDFHLNHMRQQLSRETDPWSKGRQMTAHFGELPLNILPIQSVLGMQISKAIGYAQGLKLRGEDGGLTMAIIGDGSTAEGDLHEGMNGASVLGLPFMLVVTDNQIAISVDPRDGRGIVDFEAYAKAFGFQFASVSGNDFLGCYDTFKRVATDCRQHQRPALVWVRELSRLNDHSSAADVTFKFDQYDPLLDFGEALVEAGVLDPEDIIRRKSGASKDYFSCHELGVIGRQADAHIVETMEIAGQEPEPTYDSAFDNIRDPFPDVNEAPLVGRQTVISINGALRSALRAILQANPMTWLYGQDIGAKGGVMQATKGLHQEFPEHVRDAPINEPLIIGSALGFALHEGATAIPEIQFSDYSLNAMHWFVQLGALQWSTAGNARANVIVRLPVEPLHGGAIYHSMCMEGFYGAIPGMVICAPTTSRDVYGLLRTCAEYTGPVLFFESKGLYRMPLGDAFPGEPEDPAEVAALKRAIAFEGLAPPLPADFRVPIGKAAVRRAGQDVTVVTWGRCTLVCAQAVRKLEAEGIDCELIDMRTIVPPDMETVLASVRKTGRLLIVHEDRVFSSIGREIQGAVVEAMNGTPIVSRVLGQDPVPGIPQNVHLEDRIVVNLDKVYDSIRALLAVKTATPPVDSEFAPVLFKPNRYFVA